MSKLTDYGRCVQNCYTKHQSNSQQEMVKCMCTKCQVTSMYNTCEKLFDAVPQQMSQKVKDSKKQFEQKCSEGKLI